VRSSGAGTVGEEVIAVDAERTLRKLLRHDENEGGLEKS
jgi:hypothetical protein